MDEILDSYLSEIKEILGDIKKQLELIHSSIKSKEERKLKIVLIQKRLERCLELFKQFKIDIKDLADPALKSKYFELAKELATKINKIKLDIHFVADQDGKQNVDDLNSQQILQIGAKTQIKSSQSLTRAIQNIEETKIKGIDIAQTLSENTRKLNQVENQLDEMIVDTKIAKKQVGAYARKLITDKIFICLIILIILGILILIIFKILKSQNLI